MARELAPASSQDLNYLTRTVMMAFGRPELLPTDTPDTLSDYVTDFSKAFPEQVEARGGEDRIVRLVDHFGPGVLRSSVVAGLRETTAEEDVAGMIDTLETLAGDDERAKWLAGRVKSELLPDRDMGMLAASPERQGSHFANPDETHLFLGWLSQRTVA